MTEQLTFLEPSGPQVLELALKHEKDANRALALAQSLDTTGWFASSKFVYQSAEKSFRLAAEMYMLAEFEALGGVS